MTKPNFDMTINMGNVITMLALCIASIIAYTTLQNTANINTREIERIHKVVITMPIDYIKRNEFEAYKQRLDRIESKLDRLIEIQIQSN